MLSSGREYEEKEEFDSKIDLVRDGDLPLNKAFTAQVEDIIPEASLKERGQKDEKDSVKEEHTMEVGIMKSSEDCLKKTSQQVKEASDYSVQNTSECVEVMGEVKEDFNESPLLDRQINIESTKNVMQEMPMQMRDHLSISSDSKSSMKQNHEGHPEDYLKYQQSPLPQIENFVEGKMHEKNYENGRANEMRDRVFCAMDSMHDPFNDIPFQSQALNDIPWSEGDIDRDYGPPEKQATREKVFHDDQVYDDDDDCNGVTLSPTTSEVSSLSVPSCLLSIDSSSISESSSSSDEDTGAMESTENTKQSSSSVKGPSEASSSQTSEAATTLIHSALGTLNSNFGMSSNSTLPYDLQNQLSSSKGILSYDDDEPNKVDDNLFPAWKGDDHLFNIKESTNVPLEMTNRNKFNSEIGSDCQTFFSQSPDFAQENETKLNGGEVMPTGNVEANASPVNKDVIPEAIENVHISHSPMRRKEVEKEEAKEEFSSNSRRRMFERTYPGVPTSQPRKESN